MKIDILKNLFVNEDTSQNTVEVLSKVSSGRYEVRDDLGNVFQVDSSSTWANGERVVIQLGRIVSKGGQAPNIKTYQV